MAYRWFRQARPTSGDKLIGVGPNIPRFICIRVTRRDGHMAWTSPAFLDTIAEERENDR